MSALWKLQFRQRKAINTIIKTTCISLKFQCLKSNGFQDCTSCRSNSIILSLFRTLYSLKYPNNINFVLYNPLTFQDCRSSSSCSKNKKTKINQITLLFKLIPLTTGFSYFIVNQSNSSV